MDFWLGLLQLIGVHTILGLSAYIVLQTGQGSMAQAGFFSIGAYLAAMLTALADWHLLPALLVGALTAGIVAGLVGFPALRVKGLMLVVATVAFGEFIRLFWFNFDYQISKGGILIGPEGGLSTTERDNAIAAGFTAASLGPRILRTETAAIAALSVLQALAGDLA